MHKGLKTFLRHNKTSKNMPIKMFRLGIKRKKLNFFFILNMFSY